MSKKKEPRKLPKPEEVPGTEGLVKKIAERKERLAKVKAGAAKEASAARPKFRAALKRLKRSQRQLFKVLKNARVAAAKPAADAAAPAAAPAQGA